MVHQKEVLTMVMSWIWTGFLTVSIFCSILSGSGDQLAPAVLRGAQAGVTLAVSMAGSLCRMLFPIQKTVFFIGYAS